MKRGKDFRINAAKRFKANPAPFNKNNKVAKSLADLRKQFPNRTFVPLYDGTNNIKDGSGRIVDWNYS